MHFWKTIKSEKKSKRLQFYVIWPCTTNDGSFFLVLRAMITMLYMLNQIHSKFNRVGMHHRLQSDTDKWRPLLLYKFWTWFAAKPLRFWPRKKNFPLEFTLEQENWKVAVGARYSHYRALIEIFWLFIVLAIIFDATFNVHEKLWHSQLFVYL